MLDWILRTVAFTATLWFAVALLVWARHEVARPPRWALRRRGDA